MNKRNFGEMVAFFNRRVAEMDIAKKHKMELLGMITAIEMKHDELMPKWIPVTEVLPEKLQRVLVTIKRTDGEMRVRSGNYSDDYFWIDNGDYWKCNEVLAWMPLPEPAVIGDVK